MENKNKNRMIVINLWGGPGSGKSTLMAGLFYELKRRGYNCEMSSEYAKGKVYGENFKDMEDQLYITAKQHHQLSRLNGKVDFVITDNPLPLGIYYDKSGSINFRGLVMELFKSYENINFFIERDLGMPYEEGGRLQTLEESKVIDKELRHILVSSNIPYISIPSRDALFRILDFIAEYRGGSVSEGIQKTEEHEINE